MIKKIMLMLGVLFLLVFSVVTVDDSPPNLFNHQFYGEVIWDVSTVTPTTVLAKIGDRQYTSAIKSIPCLRNPCNGKYGYDPDNILRIQGAEGEKVTFYVGSTKVKEYTYKIGETTLLDLDLTAKPAETSSGSGGGLITPKTNVTTTYIPSAPEEPDVYVPPQVPSFGDVEEPSVSEDVPEVEEEEDEGTNIYLILGIILVVLAIAGGVIYFLKKRNEGVPEI